MAWIVCQTKVTRSLCCHHFRDGKTEAGHLKPLAKLSYSQLQTQLLYVLFNVQGFFKQKREIIIIAIVKV